MELLGQSRVCVCHWAPPCVCASGAGGPLGSKGRCRAQSLGGSGSGRHPSEGRPPPETDLIIPCSEGVNVSEKNEFILVCPKLVFFLF